MKFKRHVKLEHDLEQINIAPMIDVIFQMLIFFMLSSSFTFQSGIAIKLPRAITSDIIQEENLVVTITSEDIIYFNNTIVTVEELRVELNKPLNKRRSILIKSDRRSSVGRIVDVWDLCREAGIERLNIATNQER